MKWIGCTVCEIFAFKLCCDLETRVLGSLKVIENGTIRWSTYDFIFFFHSNYASISYRFRHIAAYWSKIATPLYLAPPLGVKLSDLRNDPWCRKTRMVVLSDRERISMIHSVVLIQYTRVTDGRADGPTDGIGVAYTRYSICCRA